MSRQKDSKWYPLYISTCTGVHCLSALELYYNLKISIKHYPKMDFWIMLSAAAFVLCSVYTSQTCQLPIIYIKLRVGLNGAQLLEEHIYVVRELLSFEVCEVTTPPHQHLGAGAGAGGVPVSCTDHRPVPEPVPVPVAGEL